ncbi:cytochrome P450 [Infundibulicybe gibba]|nr:cytochrome P450 [Infundibulicybe gibba]
MFELTSLTLGLSGFVTWACLHVHPVRGDYAASAYTSLGLILYVSATFAGASHPALLIFTALGIHGISALVFTVLYRLSPWHPLAGYPGPLLWRTSSLFLVHISFAGKRYIVIDELHQRYGPFVRIGPSQLSIKSHSANAMIYGAGMSMEKGESYHTPGHPDAIALFFKQATREIHAERKRIWAQAFKPTSIAGFIPALERRTGELLQCIERRQSGAPTGLFDLSKVFCHWAYDLTGEMVFGGCNDLELMQSGDPDELVEGGKMATVILDSVGQSPWLMDLAWHLPLGKSMVRLRTRMSLAMQRRVKVDADTTMRDLTSYLLEGETTSGKKIPLTDLELEAIVAVQGGSDNTSTTMTLAIYYMLSSPYPYYATLQAELAKAFPDPNGSLDWGTLGALPFLNAVIHEALRLGSPYYLPRMVPQGGAVIDGRHIPEGITVAIAAYSLQTCPENFFPDPLEFRPDRWLPGGLGPNSKIEKSALYSFSSGPHMCIGKALAYQEMRYVLARVVRTYDMHLAPKFDARKYRDGILNMRTTLLREPLLVSATRRSGY